MTSWKVDNKEKLFLSSKSSLDSSKPVSGMEVAEVRFFCTLLLPLPLEIMQD